MERSVNCCLITSSPKVNEFVDKWDGNARVARQETFVDFCVNVTQCVCNWSADEREQCSANHLISESSSAIGDCRPKVNRCAPLHIPANSTIIILIHAFTWAGWRLLTQAKALVDHSVHPSNGIKSFNGGVAMVNGGAA